MNSLKIGDRVKIISSEKASTVFEFIGLMKIYYEKEAIIKRKIKFKEQKIYYKIDLDKQFFYWSENMFEKKGLLKNE